MNFKALQIASTKFGCSLPILNPFRGREGERRAEKELEPKPTGQTKESVLIWLGKPVTHTCMPLACVDAREHTHMYTHVHACIHFYSHCLRLDKRKKTVEGMEGTGMGLGRRPPIGSTHRDSQDTKDMCLKESSFFHRRGRRFPSHWPA